MTDDKHPLPRSWPEIVEQFRLRHAGEISFEESRRRIDDIIGDGYEGPPQGYDEGMK